MMRILLFISAGLTLCALALNAYLFIRLDKTEEAFERYTAALTQRLDQAELGIGTLTMDAALLRSDLVAQQIIVAEETANIREALDTSVSELASTVGTQSTALQTLSSAADVAGLIDRWSPTVYELTCSFKASTRSTVENRGSATLMRRDGKVVFVTNAHVVEEDGAILAYCDLIRSDDTQSVRVMANSIERIEDIDIAYGYLDVERPVIESSRVCSSVPRIGERILMLGYPRIGAEDSITVTEGIISGFDNKYYASSAKIERGNSGGAAVSIERDCFLGWPTLVVAGRIESLARILPASNI